MWVGAAFTRKGGSALYVEPLGVFARECVTSKEAEESGLCFP